MTLRSELPDTHRAMRVPASRWLMACAMALSVTAVASPASGADDAPYGLLRIVSPAADASLRNNRGTVRVVVQLAPPLRVDRGDRLTLWLDGEAAAHTATTEFVLTQVDRGTHTIQAQVQAANGAMLIRSEPVVFHLHQASRLAPQRHH